MPIQPKNDTAIKVDTITEKTSDAGTTIETVLLKDGYAEFDTGSEPGAPSAGDLRVYEKNTILHTRNASTRIALSESSPVWLGTTGGSANAQTASSTGVIGALYAGLTVIFIAGNTNTGTVTLNPDSLAADTLKSCSGHSLIAGQIISGGVYQAVFDGTDWIVLNPSSSWVSWSPTYGADSPMSFGSVSTTYAEYKVQEDTVFFRIRADGTTSGTASNDLTFSPPIAPASLSTVENSSVWVTEGGNLVSGFTYTAGGPLIKIRRYDSAVYSIGSVGFSVNGFYERA